jgi:hypothetical protein
MYGPQLTRMSEWAGGDAGLRSLIFKCLYKRNPSAARQRIMMISAVNPADRKMVS